MAATGSAPVLNAAREAVGNLSSGYLALMMATGLVSIVAHPLEMMGLAPKASSPPTARAP